MKRNERATKELLLRVTEESTTCTRWSPSKFKFKVGRNAWEKEREEQSGVKERA